jgi:hypothetical protein
LVASVWVHPSAVSCRSVRRCAIAAVNRTTSTAPRARAASSPDAGTVVGHAEIGGDDRGAPDLLRELLEWLATPSDEGELGTITGGPDRDGTADTGRRADDDEPLACESSAHWSHATAIVYTSHEARRSVRSAQGAWRDDE